jgi:DNA modification methylase
VQLELFPTYDKAAHHKRNGVANKLDSNDKQFHDWYRFVLSFPPHLVREYLDRFGLQSGQFLLDPFCGTGTTLVEAKIHGVHGIGVEANPMAHFASYVKVNWEINPEHLLIHANQIAIRVDRILKSGECENPRKLPIEAESLLLKDSISPLPLHKSLVLLEEIHRHEEAPYYRHELLAFAKSLVFSISNLHFGPEVGVHRIKKDDADVPGCWLKEVHTMARDLRNRPVSDASTTVYCADSRVLSTDIPYQSIDAVFTSPPYPNEKDYTRTTRLESVLLGFIHNKAELRLLKRGLLRSNTRNVYKGDDDDNWVSEHSQIQHIADTIEKRRIELGKTSGFEKLYGKVTKLYFGGMARHLAELRPFLKPGAYLGYVVGDQASYLQVLIRTGEILSDIAQSLGYELVSMDLFRTRFATATRKQMREEVVVLRWHG